MCMEGELRMDGEMEWMNNVVDEMVKGSSITDRIWII
jgi:hypothetical protein